MYSACRSLSIYGISDGVKAIDSGRMLSFIGTAVYSFEGIGLVIPIRESMAKPQYFNIVLTCMITFMGLMLCAFGLIAYLAWGPTVQPVVILIIMIMFIMILCHHHILLRYLINYQ